MLHTMILVAADNDFPDFDLEIAVAMKASREWRQVHISSQRRPEPPAVTDAHCLGPVHVINRKPSSKTGGFGCTEARRIGPLVRVK